MNDQWPAPDSMQRRRTPMSRRPWPSWLWVVFAVAVFVIFMVVRAVL